MRREVEDTNGVRTSPLLAPHPLPFPTVPTTARPLRTAAPTAFTTPPHPPPAAPPPPSEHSLLQYAQLTCTHSELPAPRLAGW